MALHQLPTQLPVEDFQLLINELTGNKQEVRQVIASAFAIAEYATGQIVPGTVVPKIVGPLVHVHRDALSHHLSLALGNGAPDWKQVLSVILSLIQTYLQHS